MIANYALNKIIGRGKDIIMENEESRFWGIHTLNDNLFLKDNIIAIGWPKMGDLALVEANREAFKEKYVQVYPEAKKGNIATSAGMLYRFCHEVQIGDYVVFPSKINREVNIGVIEGEYIYDSTQEEYVQTRKVKWLKHMPRMVLSLTGIHPILATI